MTQTQTSLHSRLKPEQVEAFRQDGWVRFTEPVFSQPKFAALQDYFELILAEQTKPGMRPEQLDKPHFVYPRLFEWVLTDEVLDIVEPILGPDLLLFSTHFICKPKSDGKRVPWHEDSAYWNGMLEPMEAVTVWLAIDESSPANGGMHVVPRSHCTGRQGFSDYENVDPTHSVFPTEIVKEQQYAAQAVPVILQPNQCSLHDSRLIHGSPANTNALRRCGFTMRFVPGHVRLNPAGESSIRLYPARGQDRAGNRLADPTRTYPDLYAAVYQRRVH